MNAFVAEAWDAIRSFVYYYPLVVSWFWMLGGLVYWYRRERAAPPYDMPERLQNPKPVSVLIPCYNEGENAEETIKWALALDYPEFEVIAINDGSQDNTGEILDRLASRHDLLRVVHLEENQGKALALRAGAMLAHHEVLICIDGDALIDPSSATWLARRFEEDASLGAVTGNPRIRNRSTVLSKVQVGEFSAMGLIKRAESSFGVLMSVSGVIVGFRRTALRSVGFWSSDALTEDIDITWKLQRAGWRVDFEPNALVWVLMPETLHGLWRQRLRWAKGGAEVLIRNIGVLARPSQFTLWPLMLEMAMSGLWVYALALVSAVGLWSWGAAFVAHPSVSAMQPTSSAMLILMGTGMSQLALSRWMDRRYENGAPGVFFWLIWYPFAYWLMNAAAAIVALPTVLLNGRGQARWVSPDRGLRVR